jgi:hypothetical protein
MGMDSMGTMGIKDGVKHEHFPIKRSVFLFLCLLHSPTHAKGWRITPSFTLSEVYSDNVSLAVKGSEKGAFITELSPGISIRNRASRNNLNLDYRMQNLHNAGGRGDFDVFHQLRFESSSEIIRNALFLDLGSNIGQQNISNRTIASDNLSGGENRTNVTAYRISPYWTPHINGYVDGEVRFSYANLMLDGDTPASDIETIGYSARLNSGKRFSRIRWLIDHSSETQKRSSGDEDVKFQESLAEIRAHYNRHFNVFTQVGYSDNEFVGSNNSNKNGFFYSFGAKWKPNERFFVEAAWGNNSFVTVDVMPTRHMHWVTTYRNKKIGTNLGNTWETHFDFRTKRSIWTASYLEDTTTTQQALLELQSFAVEDEFGNTIVTPGAQNPVQSNIFLPTLSDEVFVRKSGAISVSYRSGKTALSARFTSENRVFQETGVTNDVIGVSGSFDWQFTKLSSFFIRPSWMHTTDEDLSEDRFDVVLGFSRRIPVNIGRSGRLFAQAQYRYVNQSSDQPENEYQENRIAANLLLSL